MDLLRHLAETNGFFTRADVLGLGYDDNSITRAVRGRSWVRIRPGVLTFCDLWPDDAVQRALITAHAVARRFGDTVARSHVTAALEHGIDLFDPDLELTHVTRLDGGAGRTESGVQHHECFTLPCDLVADRFGSLMAPTQAALQAGSQGDAEQALVALDSLLHKRLGDEDLLAATFALMHSWPETQHLHVPVRMADGRCESVGESRARWLFFTQHLPAPDPQFAVHDGRGQLVGTADFAWPEHRLLCEFDGRVKYGRLLREGETPLDAVLREKRREELLCEITGWRIIRLTWADLYHPAATAARIRRLMARAA